MANNTIMTAKNTFGDGLLMDFAPDNTQATCLTHALNATLVTMNGNELSLLNDMGNGRVETAYLPEGYMPVGTCEFGGIIYIVSYNPIINKSQIGCFPSPERNISSEEIGGTQALFNLDEFVKPNDFGFNEVVSNSIKKVIYQNSLNPGDKFIVHSGDLAKKAKILSDFGNESHILGDFPKLYKVSVVAIEDSGKINYLNSDLKWYNNYYINAELAYNKNKPDLDTYRNILNSGYSVFLSKVSGKLAIMIELERILGFSSTYEIYNLKTAQTSIGDIEYQNYSIYANFNWNTDNPNINPSALVVYDFLWRSNYSGVQDKAGKYEYYDTKENLVKEGKMGEEFLNENLKCIEIPIYKNEPPESELSTNSYKYFKKYLDYNEIIKDYADVKKVTQLKDDGGIPVNFTYWKNLHHIVINNNNKQYYDAAGKELKEEGDIVAIDDFIINNYFKLSISRKLFDISIPYKDARGNIIDLRDLILSFKIAPMMEYGALTDLALTHYIDFSKIGSGEINLEGYKYYIGENLCTLQLDSSIYPEENKGVAEIELLFYDNQGLCAIYSINNRVSYSGVITSYIPLNGNTSSYKLSSITNNLLINHAGQVFTNSDIPSDVDTTLAYVYLEKEGDKITPKSVTFNEGKFINKENKEITPTLDNPIYYNDAGTLYSNMLYAVKIIYKYTNKNVLGEYDLTNSASNETEWRWLWTNTMFNLYYYNTKDFKDIDFNLLLDVTALYYANYLNQLRINYKNTKESTENSYENYGANILYINGSIDFTQNIGLLNTYNTFSLYGEEKLGVFSQITNKVYLGDTSVSYSDIVIQSATNALDVEQLKPFSSSSFNETLTSLIELDLSSGKNIWDTAESYKTFSDQLSLGNDKSAEENLEYSDGNLILNKTFKYLNIGKDISKKHSIPIKLLNFTKYLSIYETENQTLLPIKPLLCEDTAESLGFYFDAKSKSYRLKNIYTIGCHRNVGHRGKDKSVYILKWNSIDDIPNDLHAYSLFDNDLNKKSDMTSKGVYYAECGHGTGEFSLYSKGNYRFILDGVSHDLVVKNTDIPRDLQKYLFFLHVINISRNREGGKWGINSSNNTGGSSYVTNALGNVYGCLAQIGYMDDYGIHLLNDYSELQSVNTYTYGCEYLLALCLMHTYRLYDEPITGKVSKLIDYITYKYSTTYKADIFHRVSISDDNNNLLFNNIRYSSYLSLILQHIEILNAQNPNVKIKFTPITKNIPIHIVIDSLSPSYSINTAPYKYIGWESTPKITSVSKDVLYQIKDNLLIPATNNHSYNNITFTGKDSSLSSFGTTLMSSSIPNVFKLDLNRLVSIRDTLSQSYSLVLYEWTSSKDNACLGDLQYGDILLLGLKHVGQ